MCVCVYLYVAMCVTVCVHFMLRATIYHSLHVCFKLCHLPGGSGSTCYSYVIICSHADIQSYKIIIAAISEVYTSYAL